MLLKRYMRRPFVRVLQYTLVAGCIFMVYVFFVSSSQSKLVRRLNEFDNDHPGVFIGKEDVEMQGNF